MRIARTDGLTFGAVVDLVEFVSRDREKPATKRTFFGLIAKGRSNPNHIAQGFLR